MTPGVETDSIAVFLAENFPEIGTVAMVEKMDVPATSSVLYKVTASCGIYCFKTPSYKKRVGATEADFAAEWTLINRLRDKMRDYGAILEESIYDRNGNAFSVGGGKCRMLVRYYEPGVFTGSDVQLRKAGELLGAFHCAGRKLLRNEPGLWKDSVKNLVRDMPLGESAGMIIQLRADLNASDLCVRRSHCAAMRNVLEDVRQQFAGISDDEVRETANEVSGLASDETVTHNDFHPGNILFVKGGEAAVMLDLEQMRPGPRLKCLSFSICRFAFEAVRANGQADIKTGVRSYAEGYSSREILSGRDKNLIGKWIRAYELEKILRILRKFIYDGLYPDNVRKLLTHHIPIFRNADQFGVV